MPDRRNRPGYPGPGIPERRREAGEFGAEPSDIERQKPQLQDMRGQSAWQTVLAVDCSEREWGQVLITCDAQASKTAENADAPENWPWVEVRIIADINGQRFVLLEAAVGSHDSPVIGDPDDPKMTAATKSCGPVFLPLYPGEVPDRIEVHARARRGGGPELQGDDDERLELYAVGRFH
jgi:hypothetical protein